MPYRNIPLSHPEQHGPDGPPLRGTALVVGDGSPNRRVLTDMLRRLGFTTLKAGNDREALNLCAERHPDLVFMDVKMPQMDGHEVAREIERLSGGRHISVIFLTGPPEGEAMASSGIDPPSKPIGPPVPAAGIQARAHIRTLRQEIEGLYDRMRQDEEIARRVFETAVVAGNVALDTLHTHLQPADLFRGDLFLSAYAPSGDLHLLLGDFSGHGLSTALGALPTAEVFRAMTAKGFPPERILAAINRKLHGLLPTCMYLAAEFVQIPSDLKRLRAVNCGLPEGLLVAASGRTVKARIPSTGLPLGILTEVDFAGLAQSIPVAAGDRLLLTTDGVVEATNASAEPFGCERLEAVIATAGPNPRLKQLVGVLRDFCDGTPQVDDISLVEIPCVPGLFRAAGAREDVAEVVDTDTPEESSGTDRWAIELCLEGARLARADPVPMLLSQIRELEGEDFDHAPLFTVLSELFVNALEHGVLGLDSRQKADPQGFSDYFEARSRRLERLKDGSVRIRLQREPHPSGWRLRIRVKDSGPGFDPAHLESAADPGQLHGRGLALVRGLCASLAFQDGGNQAEATYVVSGKQAHMDSPRPCNPCA